jgi:hypothetical protein
MIRRALLVILALAVLSTGFAQEAVSHGRPARRGENAGYGSRDATVLSMMGWGVGLAVGIATLCALIPNNEASTAHVSSSSSSGSTSH